MPPTRTHQSLTSVSGAGRTDSARFPSMESELSSELIDISSSPTLYDQESTPARSTRFSSGDVDRKNYADPYSIPHPRLSRVFSTTQSLETDVASRPRPQTVKIQGHTFQPTIAFDTFWYWCSERHAIEERRRAGQSFPWTEDRFLQEYPFCNTFRVLDKVSQYLIREVIEKGSQDPKELVFRIALFSIFTKPATWELLVNELGTLKWSRYKREDYQRVLSEAKDNGITLYTGSFQKPVPKFKCKDYFMNHLLLLEVMMDKDLAGLIANAEYMAEIFAFIESLPGMGPFNTYQLVMNLSYSNVMHFSGMDFVVPGIGAVSGLVKIFGRGMMKVKEDPTLGEAAMRWLARHQTEHFRRLNLKAPKLGPKGRLMELADLEHALCEVDKYCRLAHPSIKGTEDRDKLRKRYKMSNDPYPAVPVLPKAWSHPQRQVARRYPGGGFPKVPKQYIIQSILEHRRMENEKVEFLVDWFGYDENTWEEEEILRVDSPVALKEYREKVGHVIDYLSGMRKVGKGREILVVWSAFDIEEATWEPESRLRQDAPVVLAEFLRLQM